MDDLDLYGKKISQAPSDERTGYMTAGMNYAQKQAVWDQENRAIKSRKELTKGLVVADAYMNQQYLDYLCAGHIMDAGRDVPDPSKIRVYKISKLVYDPEEQINDKFISVFSSLHSLHGTVAIIVKSYGKAIDFYVATRSDDNAGNAGETLCSSLKGNFPGIDIYACEGENKTKILQLPRFENAKSMASVSLIPSERDEDKDRFIQGMEKFLGTMNGKVYTAVFLAVPVNTAVLADRKRGFEELFSSLSPHSKISASFAHSESESVNESLTESISDSVNNSISNSNGTSASSTQGRNTGSSDSYGFSGDGWNVGGGSSSGVSSAYTSGTSFSNTVSRSTGKSRSQSKVVGGAKSVGETDTLTLNFENKSVSRLLERIENQLKRIDFSEAYGLWDFCAYFYSRDVAVTAQAANVYKALMMGQESSVEHAHVNLWSPEQKQDIRAILEHICFLRHPRIIIPGIENYREQVITPTSMLNGRELPMTLGFPRKSSPGIAVVEMAEFGRSVVFEAPERVKRTIEFGNIYHMGVMEDLRVPMDVDLMASHCFITGSSGSGKSYATYQLLHCLHEQGVHMLVVEPAKGEYKQKFGGMKGIRIFTTDPNVYKMLRINPFQFPENLHVLTHIEKLIQIFNASWALYAAMPSILKDAVVQSYVSCGWDVQNSVWIEGISDHKYPVFADVLDILPKIINSSDYSADSKGDYKGALLTRVQSMVSGITGLIFERSQGIPDAQLFDADCVVDLSDLGSEETIALLMGVMIMRLGEYRLSVRKAGSGMDTDEPLKHVTVLEEAHNILKRTSKDQSQEGANIVGKSVEMISNSIKEMRTYGEGFLIIDQSPMAVDTSAIENTSTKIVMNTPARDACEELSSALSLDEKQSAELSRLPTGVAAVFQKGWLTPVLMKIDYPWQNPYLTKAAKANPDLLRELRGKLITELYHQDKRGAFSVSSLKNLVTESGLDKDKKKDFNEIIEELNTCLLSDKKPSIGDFYIRIANCSGLFDVINDTSIPSMKAIDKMVDKDPSWLVSKYDSIRENSKRWTVRFVRSIQLYALIDDSTIVENVTEKVLLFLSGADKDYHKAEGSRYFTIYSVYIGAFSI